MKSVPMEFLRRWVPVFVVIAATLAMQFYLTRRVSTWFVRRHHAPAVKWVWLAFAFANVWMLVVVPYCLGHDAIWLRPDVVGYLMAGSLFWVLCVTSASLWVKFARPLEFDPSRRSLLALTAPLVAGVPLISAGFGVAIARKGLRLVEVNLRIRGLPKDLDGLRLVQLSDIHFGPFFGADELTRAVCIANEARPHIAVLTGDLITRFGDDIDGCLDILRGLKAEAGVFGCHGNHETYARSTEYTTRRGADLGFRFLRRENAELRFGGSVLNIAGYDYQRMGRTYLPGAQSLIRKDALNLLLSHNPDVFPTAAKAGFQVMLSGHTHGGQINVEILSENLNVARFFTPYVRGRYEIHGAQLYVTCGLGTVAAPVRLGAPPEVTLVKLCAI